MVPHRRSRRGIAPLAIVALLGGGLLLFMLMKDGGSPGRGGPLASVEHIGGKVGGLLDRAVDGISGLIGKIVPGFGKKPTPRPSAYDPGPWPPVRASVPVAAPAVTDGYVSVLVPADSALLSGKAVESGPLVLDTSASKATVEVAEAASEAVEEEPATPATPADSGDLTALKAAVDAAFLDMQDAVKSGDRTAIAEAQIRLVKTQADWQVARLK